MGEVVDLEKAMRLNPFYPFYYPHYIGLANLAMGQYDEAAAAFKRSTALNPEVIWPHAFLAACYGHLGDIAQARAELAEVHRINPAFTIAWLLRLVPYKRTTDSDVVVAGLRKAGCSFRNPMSTR